jgi:hypothetical protein
VTLERPHLASGGDATVPRAQGAVPALVFGVLSIVAAGCGVLVLGPAAIYFGHKARVRVKASSGHLGGETMALVGMWLGAIGIFVDLAALLVLVIAASSGGTRPH